MLLVEQNARQALKTVGRASVLETGRIARHRRDVELLVHPAVRQTCLGD